MACTKYPGCTGQVHFGYLIASRRPLKELCREQRIEESFFWNIFGTTLYMGLLEEPAARNLATEPLKYSLPPARWPDPAHLWTQEVVPLIGCHPALIQLLLAQRWNV